MTDIDTLKRVVELLLRGFVGETTFADYEERKSAAKDLKSLAERMGHEPVVWMLPSDIDLFQTVGEHTATVFSLPVGNQYERSVPLYTAPQPTPGDACAPYLKDGETPARRIQREIDDNAALLGLLAKVTRERDDALKMDGTPSITANSLPTAALDAAEQSYSAERWANPRVRLAYSIAAAFNAMRATYKIGCVAQPTPEDVRDAEHVAGPWHEGAPPFPYGDEWFLAETTFGDRVVLRALPKEYSYDYKTADETYIVKEKITRWAQFSDSEYKTFSAAMQQEQAK